MDLSIKREKKMPSPHAVIEKATLLEKKVINKYRKQFKK